MSDRRHFLRTCLVLATCLFLGTAVAADERAELKKRFEKRYPTLVKLKDAGRIGETPDGKVQVVKPEDAKRPVDPKDPKSPTVAAFLKLENDDRKALYALLAKDQKETAANVAKQNALRNYKKAAAEHFLLVKGKDGKLRWRRKKELKKG